MTYNAQGLLAELNLQDTHMSLEERHYFKSRVACHIDNIAAKFDKDTVIVEADFIVSFEIFWNEYKNKVNRKRALAEWNKLTTAEQLLAWQGIKPYKAYLKRTGYRNEVDPDRYLKNRYWENEYR